MRSENHSLVSEQRDQKQAVGRLKDKTLETKRLCELRKAELEGQTQDLLFFIKAQQEVRRSSVVCVDCRKITIYALGDGM